MTRSALPIAGKAFRIAPSQARQPVASLWKFWIEGNELYAMNRDAESMKISVHASGQTHLRMGRRDLQLLAPPLTLTDSDWRHALEIRYLVAPDRFRPKPKKLKKKEKAYLIEVADGQALILNLLLTAAAQPAATRSQFGGASTLWVASMADGRHVSLIGRVVPLDEENKGHLSRLRGADGPKATFEGDPASLHLELNHVFWGPGGNIVLIVPAGSETIRTLGKPASLESEQSKRRQPEIEFVSPSSSLTLHAPDGVAVAELVLTGETGRVQLSKNEYVATELGRLSLTVLDDRLRPGERFELRPLSLPALPLIDGRSPRQWNYTVRCSYDGTTFSARIAPNSAGLSVQPNEGNSRLHEGEQVMLTAPASELILSAAPSVSPVSVSLTAKMLLCDADPRIQ